MSEDEFNRAMKRLGVCQTVRKPPLPLKKEMRQLTLAQGIQVESFFSLYLHLRRPSSLTAVSDLHLFHEPIRPVWEDPANARGGKWTIRLRKGLADRLWEGVVLGLVGGSLERGSRKDEGEGEEEGASEVEDQREICGAVLSVRRDEDILAVWHRTGDPHLGGDGQSAKRVK